MTVRMPPSRILTSAMEFVRPAFVQTAALCTRDAVSGPEFLLIKTLQRGLWVIPKGWPMKNITLAQAAAREAWEEAGVRGDIADTPLGHFTYTKIKKSGLPVQCKAFVFHLPVADVSDAYPEAHKRERQWVSADRASELVRNAELALIVQRFADKHAAVR